MVCVVLASGLSCSAQIKHSFYAIYNRLFDSQRLPFTASDFDFSGDGRTVVVGGTDNLYGKPVLYKLNCDGSDLQNIPLPEEVTEIHFLTIDSTGTVFYFYSHPMVYRAMDGVVTGIFNLLDNTEYMQIYEMVTNGNGEYLFIMPPSTFYTGDLLRINNDGSGLETVVNNEDVIRDGGYAGKMKHFSVSHDGSKIAFIMEGFNGADGYREKAELFLKDQDGYHQLTNESEKTYKYFAKISGDGSTIVFNSLGAQWKWYSIRSDGTERVPIADYGNNFAGLDVTYDGSTMIHGEGSANGGCLVATNGSYNREIFANTFPWNLSLFYLGKVKLSDDGNKICFMYYALEENISTISMYMGYFNNPFAVQDVPLIADISLGPSFIPQIPQVPVVLSAMISDPQGTEDLKQLTCNEMVEGRKLNSGDVPVYFPLEPNDLGEGPDLVAGDGIYSTEGWTRDIVDQFSKAGIRIGVVDNSWNFVVADTVFAVSEIAAPGNITLLLPEAGKTDMDTVITLTWGLHGYASGFHLQISQDDNFVNLIIDEEAMQDTLQLISGLEFNTTYYWRVRASNGYEYGEWSDVFSFTTKEKGPANEVTSFSLDQDFPVVRPNPVCLGEELIFALPGTCINRLTIYNATGACIYTDQLKRSVESKSVTTEGLFRTGGIYFYTVITPAGTLSGSFQVLEQ